MRISLGYKIFLGLSRREKISLWLGKSRGNFMSCEIIILNKCALLCSYTVLLTAKTFSNSYIIILVVLSLIWSGVLIKFDKGQVRSL